MPRPAGSSGALQSGLVGLFALSLMEKEGTVHGYRVAERIADRTEGSWRPGPGAVYPSLVKLVERGWAQVESEGRRRDYRITPKGREFLSEIRARQGPTAPARPDLTVLWADVLGGGGVDEILLERLRRTMSALNHRLEQARLPPSQVEELREAVVQELTRQLQKLRPVTVPAVATRPPRRHA